MCTVVENKSGPRTMDPASFGFLSKASKGRPERLRGEPHVCLTYSVEIEGDHLLSPQMDIKSGKPRDYIGSSSDRDKTPEFASNRK